MVIDPDQMPEKQFEAWLATQPVAPDRRRERHHVSVPIKARAAAFAISLALWIVLLWTIGASVRQLLASL